MDFLEFRKLNFNRFDEILYSIECDQKDGELMWEARDSVHNIGKFPKQRSQKAGSLKIEAAGVGKKLKSVFSRMVQGVRKILNHPISTAENVAVATAASATTVATTATTAASELAEKAAESLPVGVKTTIDSTVGAVASVASSAASAAKGVVMPENPFGERGSDFNQVTAL